MQIAIHLPVAPNEGCPNVAPKPVACVATGVPKAGGADVAGVLKEKFPKAANGSNGSKHKLKHNQQIPASGETLNLEGDCTYALPVCWFQLHSYFQN